MEKAYTKAAASVARRILATDTTFNPDHTATGHWNFFCREYIRKKADTLYFTDYNPRWSFEWKCTGGMGTAETPVLYNDILDILQDATNCLWSDEWRVGASPIVEYTKWDRTVKTQITCEDGGTVTTKAGMFENCFKLCLDIIGMDGGWSYRGGKKVYYFAEGVGIVRTENEYCGGAKTAVYELTSYEGTGEGFMPIADGFSRRYDAIGLTDGFVGAVEYQYVADEDGDIVVFADRTGIRELPPPITRYGAIYGEILEQQLMDEGNWRAAQTKNGVNNFHLILHLIARPSRNYMNAKRSVVKPLLDMVDDGKIALTPAEKISYLTEEEQQSLYELMQDNEVSPSLSQAVKLKELSAKGMLDADALFEIMTKPKANQKETLKIDMGKLRDFFPDSTPKDMAELIFKILAEWRERNMEKAKIRFGREDR